MIAGSHRHLRTLAPPSAATPFPRLVPIPAPPHRPARRGGVDTKPRCPQPASISFISLRLRTLDLSCTFFSRLDPLFSIACALFDLNTRGGIPSHASVSVPSVPLWQTQFCRPFVFMVLRIAFPASPSVSQSSALPPGCVPPLPPLPPLSPTSLAHSFAKTPGCSAQRRPPWKPQPCKGVVCPPAHAIRMGFARRDNP